jgi:hypothetical protein
MGKFPVGVSSVRDPLPGPMGQLMANFQLWLVL